MAQKMCMMMVMVMVLVTVECATNNEAIEDYNSCVIDCVRKCGTDERCQYRCRWSCPIPHTPQFILKDEAKLPQEGGKPVCVKYCRIRCGDDEFCMNNCLVNCPF